MGIHHIYCRATASGIDNLSSITDAMTWLCGNEDLIHIDRTTSYHGSEINLITVKLSKNKDIKSMVERLTKEDLSAIASNLDQRIDQEMREKRGNQRWNQPRHFFIPGLDNTRLFMSFTAGAGTRCMTLLSSSPILCEIK